MQVSGGSCCSEECPCASGSTSNLPSFCALTNRHRHLFAGLFGCNQPRALLWLSFVNTYIYIRVSCLGVHSFLLCRRAVSLYFFARANAGLSISNSFLHLSSALRFKTPVVLPCFSTHARNNATTLLAQGT